MSNNSEIVKLISLLSDGNFHSGEELGKELSISRAAIWKRLEALKELGLNYQSVRGKGYQLVPAIKPLSQQLINEQLQLQSCDSVVKTMTTVDSTNAEVLRSKDKYAPGDVLVAEMQTEGRGRRGRVWLSPYAANINMTMYWRLDHGMKAVDGLSLIVGLAVIEALKEYGPELKLKWPNDIVSNNKKLAGILLELVGEPNGVCHIAVGIGINVNIITSDYLSQLSQDWTSLALIHKESVDRNKLLPDIITKLTEYLQRFERYGFKEFHEIWEQYDAFKDQEVIVHLGDEMVYGVAKGVNHQGELIVDTGLGPKTFNGGEVSLRKLL